MALSYRRSKSDLESEKYATNFHFYLSKTKNPIQKKQINIKQQHNKQQQQRHNTTCINFGTRKEEEKILINVEPTNENIIQTKDLHKT